MSKHFHDSRYYLRRAAAHARLGATEHLERLADRIRARLGREREPEPGRVDRVREDVTDLERRAELRVREAVRSARARVGRGRSSESPDGY